MTSCHSVLTGLEQSGHQYTSVIGVAAEHCLPYSSTAGRKMAPGKLLSALFNQFSDEASPAGLLTRADAGSIVAVKILVEEDQIPPVRVALEKFGVAGDGAAAILAAHENVKKEAGNLGSY